MRVTKVDERVPEPDIIEVVRTGDVATLSTLLKKNPSLCHTSTVDGEMWGLSTLRLLYSVTAVVMRYYAS